MPGLDILITLFWIA